MAKHIYVHIPFCKRKCDYCDFYSISCENQEFFSSYFDALNNEINNALIVEDTNDDDIDTVYFGGGTPSVPDSRFITSTLKNILTKFDIGNDAEITIECNPASVTYEKFCDYRKAGFNRVSIGVQSLKDDTLRTLGRLHNRERAIAAIKEAITSGFTNVSADLMLGIPGQSLDEVLSNARTLVELGVSHVSMYSLIIEEGTKFYDRYIDTLESLIPQELERKMYHAVRDYLRDNNIEPYEISNCGKESIHNMSYWRGYEYYAFGPASSGYLNGIRFTHIPDVKNYIDVMTTSGDINTVINVDEKIDNDEKMTEYVMLMLRTSEGVSLEKFSSRFGVELMSVFEKPINNLVEKDLIIFSKGAYSLTNKGLDFANEVFREFV